VLADTGAGLNAALTQAHRALLDLGCSEVLVLPADLPLVSAAEIDALVRAARDGGFAMSSDDAGVGTNALALVGGVPFHFQFGADSRRLHLAEAARLALAPQLLRLPGLEFDVDSPADLQRLAALQCPTRLQA
jgi:2-phospho-L-lactate guanylyltransferase